MLRNAREGDEGRTSAHARRRPPAALYGAALAAGVWPSPLSGWPEHRPASHAFVAGVYPSLVSPPTDPAVDWSTPCRGQHRSRLPSLAWTLCTRRLLRSPCCLLLPRTACHQSRAPRLAWPRWRPRPRTPRATRRRSEVLLLRATSDGCVLRGSTRRLEQRQWRRRRGLTLRALRPCCASLPSLSLSLSRRPTPLSPPSHAP